MRIAQPIFKTEAPRWNTLNGRIEIGSGPTQVDQLRLSSQDRADRARSSYNKEMGLQCLQRGVIGGVAGFALLGQAYNMPMGNLLGPALGAGVGIFTAWEALRREKSGKVNISLDGRNYQKPYVNDPSAIPLSEEEARFKLLANGNVDPGAVLAAPPQALPEPTAEQMAIWKEHSAKFRELGEQRRLVADLGQRTADQQSVVHLVDSIAAAKLAATGGKVFLVNAQEARDVEHSLSMTGFNVSHSKADAQQYRYLERNVQYTLTPLKDPSDLSNLASAQGVPEGMLGLLENKTSYGEVLNYGNHVTQSETRSPEFGNAPIQHKESSFSYQQKRLQDRRMDLDSGLTTAHHLNWPALLALMGSTAGMATAMAFTGPGVPGPALIGATVGFLGGRSLGRAIIER